jgi:hypothetical protein
MPADEFGSWPDPGDVEPGFCPACGNDPCRCGLDEPPTDDQQKIRNRRLFRGEPFSYCVENPAEFGGCHFSVQGIVPCFDTLTPEDIAAARLDHGPIIGIDAEWVGAIDDQGQAVNAVLSYQYAVVWLLDGKLAWWSGGIYPARLRRKNGHIRTGRLTMGELLDEAFRAGIRRELIARRPRNMTRAERKERAELKAAGILRTKEQNARYKELNKKWEKVQPIRVVAHTTKAELSALADFHYLKTQFDSVQKSFATMRFPAVVTAWDVQGNEHSYTVRLYDSALLSPADSRGLDALGKLLGHQKLDPVDELPWFYLDEDGRPVPADPERDAARLPFRGVPVYIEGNPAKGVERRLADVWPGAEIKSRMDLLLRHDRALFERYSVRDAEVCRNFLVKMYGKGSGRMSVTVPGLAVQRLRSMITDDKPLPRELSGLGLDPKELLERVTGYEKWEQEEYDRDTGRMRKVRGHRSFCIEYESTAVASAHGGRNECFHYGPTDAGYWNDFDISSAYGTVISGLGLPNWAAGRFSKDPLEYRPETLGFARVRFKFPRDTRYPSMPVKDYEGAHGLVYPLEGETYVPAAEIATALSLGADITIIFGGIIPWDTFYLFYDYIKQCGTDRAAAKALADKFGDGFYKLMQNGLFGKFGQGLHGALKRHKMAFSTREGDSIAIDLSPISSPFLASYITGAVRAAVSEMIASVPGYRNVLSVTTDGFLTDATKGEISYGPTARHIANLRRGLVGADDILEQKAQVRRVLTWRTRGVLTLEAGDNPDPTIRSRVLAKAGVQVPSGVHMDRPLSRVENDYVLTRLAMREPKDEGKQFSLTSIRKLFETDGDLVGEIKHPLLNFEYDMKRELVGPPKLYDLGIVSNNGPITHIALGTRPWPTMEAFKKARAQFDAWHRQPCKCKEGEVCPHGRVLRAPEDWQSWSVYQISGKAPGNRNGGWEQQAVRHFLRCYVRQLNGLPGGDYGRLVKMLTAAGIKVTVADVKNAARASRRPSAEPVPAPWTLYKQLEDFFPGANWPAIFAPVDYTFALANGGEGPFTPVDFSTKGNGTGCAENT